MTVLAIFCVFRCPDEQENGFSIPDECETRVDVLSELLTEQEPLFEFDPGEMTVDRRFLVDFGFARIRQPDS